MDRDEILKRSRAEKEDEGNTFLGNRGRRFGVVGFCAMFWSYISLEAWGKYRASHRQVFLTSTVLAAVSSLCFLACYVLEVLR